MTVTITHVFDDHEVAQDAVDDLQEAGFTSNEISLVSRHNGPDKADVADGAATGATLGGVAGAGAGLLAALGVIAIPGIGPLVAAGVLATTLAGAATGAVAGGVLGALMDYGISEEDAHVYAESVRRGGSLVSIRVDEKRADEAETIMQNHRPVDAKERRQSYRESGWTTYDPSAPAFTQSQVEAERERIRQTIR